jgi:hypothetical protein
MASWLSLGLNGCLSLRVLMNLERDMQALLLKVLFLFKGD